MVAGVSRVADERASQLVAATVHSTRARAAKSPETVPMMAVGTHLWAWV